MSFPRYESYKDSGVEWLGEVPEHWEVISIKWLSPVQRGASPRPIDDPKYFDEDGEYAWVRIADVSASDGVLRETTQKLSVLGSSLSVKIAPGELFVSIAGTVGKPCISEIKACIHDGFVYFPRLKINPKLLYRIFESETCYGGLGKWGTQLNLNTDTIGSIRVALPPQKELSLVLSFLDRETAKIDVLIAEQQRLIELLKEKRQSVISHAVTKGLSPNAPMKDSGIEWLGEVPEHWGVVPLRWFASCASGNGISIEQVETEADTKQLVPVIGGNGVMGYTNLVNVKHSILAVGRVGALCGNVHIVNPPAWVTDNALILYAAPNAFDLTYLASVLRSRNLNDIASKTAQPLITGTQVRDQRVPQPPLEEQSAIVNFLERETAKLDALTTEAKTAITLLQERRTALISAAVTGKIDVRGLVSAKTEVKAETVPC